MVTGRISTLGLVLILGLGWFVKPAAADPFKIIITETETPLVPNSVIDLAQRLGFYAKAGVDVELVRVQQTPSAVAALRAGQGDMANISFDVALQLVARDQMKLKGVISPDRALPFMIVAKKAIATPKLLEGKVFGVARVGSVDYVLSRAVFAAMGVDPDKMRFLAVGQPAVRAQSLLAGRIDATSVSVGTWTSLDDTAGLTVLVDQANFFKRAPFLSKLNVVTEEVRAKKAKEIEGVVRGIMLASRAFAQDPKVWVDAMAAARPDVKRATLEALAENYRQSWSANGGLSLKDAAYTTDMLYKEADFADLRRVPPAEWIDTSFLDKALAETGIVASFDQPSR